MKTKLFFIFLLISKFYFSQNLYSSYGLKLKYDFSNKPDSVKNYFDEVCNNNTNNLNMRYSRREKDVYIFLCVQDSSTKKEYFLYFDSILNDLNNLIKTVEIHLTDDKTKMNSFACIGSFDYFNQMSEKYERKVTKLKPDETVGGYANPINSREEIYYSYFFVNFPLCKKFGDRFVKHVILEELVQSLGFRNDSWKYEDSIFYDGFNPVTCKTYLSELDREIINILYNENTLQK